VWNTSSGTTLHSQPTVSDGVVYLEEGDGYIHAYDAATGKGLWADSTLANRNVASSVVVNGVVYGVGVTGHLIAWTLPPP
jgi:outer membrane protein assembly factor BamB